MYYRPTLAASQLRDTLPTEAGKVLEGTRSIGCGSFGPILVFAGLGRFLVRLFLNLARDKFFKKAGEGS
jgi:hypothetical protein